MDTDGFLQTFSSVEVLPLSIETVVALLAACLLLLASGFISASEIAFFSLTPQDKSDIDASDNSSDKVIKSLLDRSEYLLATILTGNNLVNIAVVIVLSFALSSLLVLSPILEFVLQSIILTFLLLLFGEIMPKIYASNNTLKMARTAAPLLQVLQRIFYPVAYVLVHSTTLVNKYMSPKNANISISEISQALEMTDVQVSDEKELLQGIVNFGGKTVEEVMTPRVDMADVDVEADYEKLVAYIVEQGYSRIPVYEGTADNIKGIIYIKDLLPYLKEGVDFEWQKLMRTPYFVPENKKIENLLEEFREQKIHMAIVVDEYGGTSGLVSMEDILEEIVGEITDEYDEEEQQYKRLDDTNYLFDAKILLNDFYRVTGIEESEFTKVNDAAETLAGLILEIKEEFPYPHERITYGRYQFIVLETSKRRIIKVKLTIRDEQLLQP